MALSAGPAWRVAVLERWGARALGGKRGWPSAGLTGRHCQQPVEPPIWRGRSIKGSTPPFAAFTRRKMADRPPDALLRAAASGMGPGTAKATQQGGVRLI